VKRAFAIWSLAFACFLARSQVPSTAATTSAHLLFQLSGKVTDTAGIALSRATIQWIAATDTLHVITGEDGGFILNKLPARKFRLSVTMKGYLPFSRSYVVSNDQRSVKLQPITLQIDFSELDPVTITRVRPVTIQEDTVSYNTAAFPVRDGSEVEDILKRLPGVEVDINGNVIVQGKPITKVLVNGKEFFGSDVLLAIQNLPADVVQQLQVIDDYGDEARLTGVKSGESTKVLNIVLKSDKRNGEFGRIDLAAGDQGKYANNAFGNVFKGDRQISANGSVNNNSPAGSDPAKGGGFNYADQWNPKWGGAINFNTGSQSPHSASSSVSTTYYPGEQLEETQDNRNSSYNGNNNLSTRLTFRPDPYSTLRLSTSGSINQSDNQVTSNFTSAQLDSGYTKSTTGQSINSSQSTNSNLNSNLYYERLSPHSRRRFSVDASVGYTGSSQSGNEQSTASMLTDSLASTSFLHYVTSNTTHGLNLNLNSTYFLPLGPTSFLETGYKMQTSASSNNSLTQTPDSVTGELEPIDSLSEKMLLRSEIQNFHAAYTGKLSNLDLTAALDAQPGLQRGTVDSKGDVVNYHYFSLLPNVQAAWSFDKSRRLNLSYSSQPNLPGLQQLAPFTNVTNPQYPVTGNPNLKPSYTDNIGLHYEQANLKPTQFFGFGMGLNYSSTRHTIIQDLTTPKDSSQVIQATTYLNAGNTNNLTADYHLTLPAFLHKRLRINYSGSLAQIQTITMTDSIQYPTQTRTWSQTLHLQLLIPNLIESDLSGSYNESHTSYPANSNLPNSFRSAVLTFNGKLYFFSHWILNYQLAQPYTSNGNRLETAPATLTASLQCQFLPHNMATISLNGYNLLNQSAAVGQSNSSTTITQGSSVLTGCYFLLSFQLKLQRLRQ
jgi:hypothetical protein